MNTHVRFRPYKCNFCDEKFYTKHNANRHEEAIHEKDETKYKCDLCDYNTYAKGNFNYHMQKNHKLEEV